MSAPRATATSNIKHYSLSRVPESERRSGWGLMTNTAGIASTLVQVAIAAAVTSLVGVKWGIVAGVMVAIFGGALGWLVGHVAYVSGTSSTVTARHYGLGRKGSVIASVIFAFMILGFLALENALLYYGTLFAFGWAPSTLNAIVIYGVLTVAWILLTMYGLKIVQRTSTVLLIGFTVLVVVMAVVAVARSQMSLADIWNMGPVDGSAVTPTTFGVVISMLAGSAGALALVDADYARYARSTKDVGILAVGGAVMIDIIVVVIGAVIVHASTASVTSYLGGNPAAAASAMGATIADKVTWMIANNTGAYFIIVFGGFGFVLMYIAQVKAQVLNTFSGALTLLNLSEGITGRLPKMATAVVIGNVIALAMIVADILGQISSFLGVLGVCTTALATVMVADFFIVRRRVPADHDAAPEMNWAGVLSVVGASITGGVLEETGVTSLGFVVSLVIVLVAYPPLRMAEMRMMPSAAIGAADATSADVTPAADATVA